MSPCLFNCPPTFLPLVAENDSSHNQDHPRQLGDFVWGEENRGWDILGKKYLGNWVKWCCHSLLSLGKWKESREQSRVLFISGFLSWWMGKPREKLTPVGVTISWRQWCQLFRFQTHSISCLTEDQLTTLCSKPGPHQISFFEAKVSLDSFMCRGVGNTVFFFFSQKNYVDSLNCALVNRARRMAFQGLVNLGETFMSLGKQCFALKS